MRVLVIGLDGATLDLIMPWAEEGKLPTFYKLMSEGSYGNLESVIPTLTIPAWNCFASGKNPGKIGCFSFVQKAYKSYNFQFPFSLVKKEKDIWDILSDYGKKVFVLNAPNVQYAYKINGCMVAGPLYISEERLTYPRSLREELYEMHYEKDITDPNTLLLLNDYEFSRKHKEITESQFNALFHFIEKKYDFGFAVFSELDRVQHKFWDRKKLILSHYQNIDRKLKDLLHKLEQKNDRTNIIIVSDHGFGPDKRIFLINEWLIRKRLLTIKKSFTLKFTKTLARIQKRTIITKMLRSLSKYAFFKSLYLRIAQSSARTPIVWDATKAFSYAIFGQVYINLKGREPQGIVKKEEYELLRNKIIKELQEKSVKAFRREELYYGDYLELAPDIIIQTDDYVNSISAKVGYGKEFIEGFGGSHRINGIFIAWGPDIKENLEIKAKIYDVAPTILHMFGIPIPKDMDGRVLKEIFKGELAMREIKYQEIDERNRIKKKLGELRRRGTIF